MYTCMYVGHQSLPASRTPKAAVRQSFYRAGRALLGGDVLEWAPDDVLQRSRSDSGRGSGGSPQPRDPDQTILF